MTTVLLIPHMDAGDRNAWTADHDVRPLSELGRRQAEALAEALAERGIRALFASPALRARQTLEPLGMRLGLPVVVDVGLSEKRLPEDRPALARRAWETLRALADSAPDGQVAAASHGDLIPAVVQYITVERGLEQVPEITRRGTWYEIEIEGDTVRVTLNEGPEGFPV